MALRYDSPFRKESGHSGRLVPAFRLDANRPLSQQVYELLRQAIGDLRLLPNDALSEKDIADELGMSRTPVREAFIRLSEDGIVRIVPKSGTYVAPVDTARVNEGYFVWSGLSASCAAQLAEHGSFASVSQLRALSTSQNNCLHAGDGVGFRQANNIFHESIFTLADFPGAAEMVADARFEIHRLLGLCSLVEFDMSEAVIAEQWQIINFIADKKPAEAHGAMLEHLSRVKTAIDNATAILAEREGKPPGTPAGRRQKH